MGLLSIVMGNAHLCLCDGQRSHCWVVVLAEFHQRVELQGRHWVMRGRRLRLQLWLDVPYEAEQHLVGVFVHLNEGTNRQS